MNARVLYLQQNEEFVPSGRFYCSKCQKVHLDQPMAEACCRPRVCACGQPAKLGYTVCDECRIRQEEEREIQRFEQAEKLTQWDGPVWCDQLSYNEGYFPHVGELLESWEDEHGDRPLPDYVWTCHDCPMVNVDTDDVTSGIEFPENVDITDLLGMAELKAALDAFNQANAGFRSWSPNRKKALLLK